MTSKSVRSQLVEALQLDLVGPANNHAFAQELLPESPTRWYLTGFLVPSDAPLEQRIDETATEQIDSGGTDSGGDDAVEIDRGPARRSILPSSMGVSVLVPADLESLEATVSWGDYVYEGGEEEDSEGSKGSDETSNEQLSFGAEEEGGVTEPVPGEGSMVGAVNVKPGWRRKPREETVSILLSAREKPLEVIVPHGSGLSLVVTVRPVSATAIGADRLPAGTRS